MSLTLAQKPLEMADVLTHKTQIDPTDKNLTQLLPAYLQAKTTSVLVFWQRQRILWATYTQGKITLPKGTKLEEDQTLEVRAFNEKEELHLLRQDGQYQGRYLYDQETLEKDNEATAYVDSFSRFWGKCISRAQNYALLRDDERFLQMLIPVSEDAEYYGLITRNYVGVDETTGQAGYVDYRYLRIESAERGK